MQREYKASHTNQLNCLKKLALLFAILYDCVFFYFALSVYKSNKAALTSDYPRHTWIDLPAYYR